MEQPGLAGETTQGRFCHPHPTDYWRWTTDVLTSLVTRAAGPESLPPLLGAVPLGLWLGMMNLQGKPPAGLRHVVSLFNLVIRWSNGVDWGTYRADFVHVVLAERELTDG